MTMSSEYLRETLDGLTDGVASRLDEGIVAQLICEVLELRDRCEVLVSDLKFAQDENGDLFVQLRELQEPPWEFKGRVNPADWDPPAWSRRLDPELQSAVEECRRLLRYLGPPISGRW